MIATEQAFALAINYHQTGELRLAEQLYRQILQAKPDHAGSHHLLGVLDYQNGRFEEAIAAIKRAVTLNPKVAAYHSNLGLAYEALGQTEEALAEHRESLRLVPLNSEAHCNLGRVLFQQGRLDESVSHYRQAIGIQPTMALAHYGLAAALAQKYDTEEVITHYREALRLDPDFVEARSNLAGMLLGLGQLEEAEFHCLEAMQRRPNLAEPYSNLGNVRFQQRRMEEGASFFREAIRLKPLCAEAHSGLAEIMLAAGKGEEAVQGFQQAISINPDFTQAHDGLGRAYLHEGEVQKAMACFETALRLQPDFAEAQCNIGNALHLSAQTGKAMCHFREALRLKPDLAGVQNNLVSCSNYDPDVDLDTVFEDHCRWGQLQQRGVVLLPHRNDPSPDRVLKIGYLSPDFRRHALARYIEPVLAHHDPRHVEVTCYAEVPVPDAVTERLRKLAYAWKSTCNLSDDHVANLILSDRIDILVDLAGHTTDNRLSVFARKPAPVQVTWLGYMNTTGLTTVDYRLTDSVLDPDLPSDKTGVRHDTEELVRLPHGMCCFAPPEDAPEVSDLPTSKRAYVTFGSLHNLFKLNWRVFDLWSKVLEAVPASHLLMYRSSLSSGAQEHIRQQFAQRGIVGERLDLRIGSDVPGYLQIYDEIDISLDTFPCSGGVTTCESLWMGAPVISLCGVRPASRNSAALLSRLGMADWIANTPEQYVDLAAHWSEDVNNLAKLRAGLRERTREALCDGAAFTRELENAYRTMWRRWCADHLGGTP